MKPIELKKVKVRSASCTLTPATSDKSYMNRFLSVQSLKTIVLGASSVVLLSACTVISGPPSAQATAQSAISQGNVNVRLVDRVAVVTGTVPDASAEQAVYRALLKRDDVDSVDMQLAREM